MCRNNGKNYTAVPPLATNQAHGVLVVSQAYVVVVVLFASLAGPERSHQSSALPNHVIHEATAVDVTANITTVNAVVAAISASTGGGGITIVVAAVNETATTTTNTVVVRNADATIIGTGATS